MTVRQDTNASSIFCRVPDIVSNERGRTFNRAVDGAEERSLPHGETKPRDDNLALVAQLADRVNRKNAMCLVVCGAATQELVACLLTEFVTFLYSRRKQRYGSALSDAIEGGYRG